MTPATMQEYGGLIFGAFLASQVSIRAITRRAPASFALSSRLCCRS